MMFFMRVKALNLRNPLIQHFRTFLSESFSCKNDWSSRLSHPFMKTITIDRFYYEIEKQTRAIDLDLYVNKLSPESDIHHLDEVTDLLQKVRSGAEATKILDSTQHAVIRNLVDSDYITELLHILENRIDYGVFLDNYIASYTLNILIQKKDFRSAARVAGILMLEEDFSDPLARAFSLYSVYKYLEKCEPFHEPAEEAPAPTPKGKVQEVKVRVKFLRNEYFDDHFDLKDHKHIVGKVLVFIAKHLNPVLEANLRILGYILYQKNDKAIQLLKSTNPQVFYKDVINYCIQFAEDENIKQQLEKMDKSILKSENFEEVINDLLNKSVQEYESKAVDEQKKVYQLWNTIREQKYKEALEMESKKRRIAEIEKLQEEMKLEEQKLWFFENEEKIDLDIERKKVYYPEKRLGKIKKPSVVDEDYIPPEIVKHRK